MKFYEFYQEGEQIRWGAMHTYKTEEQLKLKENIFLNQFWENPVTVPMMLRDDPEEQKGNPPVIQDYYTWRHDILLKTYPEPAGKLMVISSKLKQVFETLSIPSHRYYLADIPNGGGHQYFIFQVLDSDSIIDYTQTPFFTFEKKGRVLIERLEKGEVKDFEDFRFRRSKLLKERKNISFDEFHFDKHYDIIPAKVGILASERAKKAIEEAGCTGITFSEYDQSYEEPIFMPDPE